ncbi:protein HOMOLOG OF MAMMALIAN LYST-INTERACTING PROTEIN 5-like isoform X1 [Rosa rugosa]|uniref:protein HOMOLOG OF MAMMALIAN LYST-INTERACTING PROTEIN 5-like isoform X1 n=1 Tax=Rosa rugosa TaxID=74645 RepID=UPI002B405C30|nr:protein HOMOLOG OF MAMMALIAN LYST-INTERACTING PROTEIN 5-like isoform X1 [Rosa rugosa]
MERGLKIPQNKCTKTTNSLLISLMKQLEKLEQKQKYAAWKAADIRKAVKEGRKPQAGPPAACLPTLATIPIWIGLYQALSNVANEIALEGSYKEEFVQGI